MSILGRKPEALQPEKRDPFLFMEEQKWQEKESRPEAVKARRRVQIKVSEMAHHAEDVNTRAKRFLPAALSALSAADTESYNAACKRAELAGLEHGQVLAELSEHEAGEATAKSLGEWRLQLHSLRHKEAVMRDVFREALELRDRLEVDLRKRLRATVGRSITSIDDAYKELRAEQRAEVLALCEDKEPLSRLDYLLQCKPLSQLLGGKV